MRLTRRAVSEDGFTLVEVLVAATILVVGVLSVLGVLVQANRTTSRTKAREAATNLAREIIEAARAVPYPDLIPPELNAQLQSQPGLDDAVAGGGWQLIRRDVTFTITASVCSVDDGSSGDGYGDHTGGYFCSDSTQTGTADSNPDDYKRVSITVSWKSGPTTSNVRQDAVINNSGSAFAPAIKTLVPTPATPIGSGTTSVAFSSTTSTKAQDFKWFVDNVERGDLTGPSASFNFTWDLTNVVDGTYLVSAQAYDRYGQSGAGRIVTMVVNRFAPNMPTGLIGGRNPLWGSNVVDLEWDPNPERDITGYEVYRVKSLLPSATNDILICKTSVDDPEPTSCVDSNPPVGVLYYYVRAIAPARAPATGSEKSAMPTLTQTLAVDGVNLQPSAPASVTVDSTSRPGENVLTWPAASDTDGTIRYYRIYRDDNSSYTVRYDRTGTGADLTYTDSAGGTHRYWVTAVDNKLAESNFAPPGGVVGG